MSNVYKYLFVCIGIVFVFILVKYYNLYTDNQELQLQYTELHAKYIVEKANTSALENSIKSQNILLEQYKKSTEAYEDAILKMNDDIVELNKIVVDYDRLDSLDATSDEAIKWLIQKASSLVQ